MSVRRKTSDGSRCGAVLILVLLLVATIAFLTAESAKMLTEDYASGLFYRATMQAPPLLDSGLELAAQTLLDDRNSQKSQFDCQYDLWGKFDEFLEKRENRIVSGSLLGNIEDENGRIPVNMLIGGTVADNKKAAAYEVILRRVLDALMSRYKIKGDSAAYVLSIKRWIGVNDKSAVVDDGWYASREPAYERSKQPMRSPDELMLIRWEGVKPEDVRTVYLGRDGGPGLRDFVTVWGSGPINMNTCSVEILNAVGGGNDAGKEFAKQCEEYRSQSYKNMATRWFDNIAVQTGIQGPSYPGTGLGVSSNYFRVNLEAQFGVASRKMIAIVERGTNEVYTLFRHVY